MTKAKIEVWVKVCAMGGGDQLSRDWNNRMCSSGLLTEVSFLYFIFKNVA